MSLDIVPENHSLLKVKKLEEEGQQLFETLISYQASADISRCLLNTSLTDHEEQLLFLEEKFGLFAVTFVTLMLHADVFMLYYFDDNLHHMCVYVGPCVSRSFL